MFLIMHSNRPICEYAASLLLMEVVFFLIIQPFGNFPLNDDWAYAHSVTWLIDQGRLSLSDWIAMNLLPQTLMGAAVTKILGFSFSTLRGLTQVVALLTSLVAFAFFRACGLGLRAAFLGAVALVCLPWWQALANTYMSDMYGLLFALMSAYALVRYLDSLRWRYLLLGALFAVIGTLERQVVLVIPLGYACALLYRYGFRSWRNWLAAMLPMALALMAEYAYQWWLAAGPGIPLAQQAAHGRVGQFGMRLLALDATRWTKSGLKTLEIISYLGLFLAAPLSVLLWNAQKRRLTILAIVAALALFFASLLAGWLPPYRANNLVEVAGIGPYTLADGLSSTSQLDRSKGIFWQAAAGLAALGVVLLFISVGRIRSTSAGLPRSKVAVLVMLAVASFSYLLPFVITDYFDRYLLFVYPLLFACIVLVLNADAEIPKRRWLAALVFTFMVGLIGAVAVHDYFAWNRARWAAINYAEGALGASPVDMDGGFEYNGFYNYESRKRIGGGKGKRWWWVVDDRFLVAFTVMPGYGSVRCLPVNGYLPSTPRFVHLLKRDDSL